MNAPVYNWSGNLLWGPQWRVELYGGATSNSLRPAIDVESGRRLIVPFRSPGYFAAGSLGTFAVVDVPAWGWAWLQVKVWDVGLGPTYEQAVARELGGHGESALFYARGNNAGATPPGTPGILVGLQSFRVLPVIPEPSTWALLVLARISHNREDAPEIRAKAKPRPD